MKWTKTEITYLELDYPISDKEIICHTLGRSWDSIQAKALRLGIFRAVRINLAETNGQWKGGVNDDYYNRIAFENYPNICSVCGESEKLEVHHKDKNRKNNVLENLMIVCTKCHGNIHKEMNGWAQNFDECIICCKKDTPHNAHGMCKKCYYKVHNGVAVHTRVSRQQKGSNGKFSKGTRRKK